MRRICILAALSLWASLALTPTAHAAPEWLAPELLSEAGHHAYETAVAMNAGGEAVSVWSVEGKLQASVRPAGGAFSAPITIDSTAADTLLSPGVAINAAGAIAVAWQDLTTAKYEVSIRPPGGSFSAPIPIASPTSHISFFTSVAIDEAGDVLVGTLTEGPGHFLASYAWRPAGGSFSLLPLSEPLSNNAFTPTVALDAAGDGVVAWPEKPGSGELVVNAIRRPAGGAFSAPQTLSDSAHKGWQPSVAMGAGGQAAVAWTHSDGANERIQVSTSTGASALMSAPQTISRVGANGEYPAVAVSASGQAVVAWSETGTGEIAGGPVGGSFGPATDLDAYSGELQLAIDAAGDAIAVWANLEGSVIQAAAAVRSASGVVSTPVALSTPAESVNRLGNVATVMIGMDNAGDAVAGWSDQVSGVVRTRIYKAASPTTPPSAPPSPPSEPPRCLSPALLTACPPTPCGQDLGHPTQAAFCLPRQCVTPRLAGLTRNAAKRSLLAAGCKLGKVRVAKRYRHSKRLVVAAQSVKPGQRLALGSKISVTLKPPPPPRHVKKHR